MDDPERTIASSSETRLVKSGTLTGSMAVNYAEETIRIHAVALDDGQPAEGLTVCGESIMGAIEGSFERVAMVIRCGRCADALGMDHLGA